MTEIHDASVNAGSDLGTILRKCKVLASKLNCSELGDWLIWESNGYPENVEVPNYRIWRLEMRGHFSGVCGSGLRNAPVPMVSLPEHIRASYERYKCRNSISNIEATLQGLKSAKTLQISTGDLNLVLGKTVYQYMNCLEVWGEFNSLELVEVLNTVRNRILDFTLKFEKEISTENGEIAIRRSEQSDNKIAHIFHTTIYGGSPTIGTCDYSQNLNITYLSPDSLEKELIRNHVPQDDIKELLKAINEDVLPAEKKNPGPKVTDWICNMMKKAADGTWKVSLTVAGNVLTQAVMKYYGF
ncbi:MAG: hypothetical protein PHW04_09690 [Candidatus Wallbacteria bacterium]|nr:hypothetical protein [Candidatus Wallbacteria bacterium]